jgi:hypothetical protein
MSDAPTSFEIVRTADLKKGRKTTWVVVYAKINTKRPSSSKSIVRVYDANMEEVMSHVTFDGACANAQADAFVTGIVRAMAVNGWTAS